MKKTIKEKARENQMKGKWKKRDLSLMLTAGMILGGITAMPEDSDFVSAADITNDQPSWFIGNSATNPHTASNWTCFYGKNGSFFKMTAREGESGQYIWHPEDDGYRLCAQLCHAVHPGCMDCAWILCIPDGNGNLYAVQQHHGPCQRKQLGAYDRAPQR